LRPDGRGLTWLACDLKPSNPSNLEDTVALFRSGVTVRAVAAQLGIARSSAGRLRKEDGLLESDDASEPVVARTRAARSTSALGGPRPAVPGVWRLGHGDKASGAPSADSRTSPRLARSGLEHSLGKGEVVSSILTGSTRNPLRN
jgi:hypothetical protein